MRHSIALVRALLPAVLSAAALMLLLVFWIRSEPVEVTRGLEIALGVVPAAVFAVVLLRTHRAGG